MTITLRGNKSTELTFEEMDGNFTDLDTRTATIEGSYVTSVNGITTSNKAITLTSANITENSNLYYTDARSRSAISITDAGGDGSLVYNNVTGVITYTGPSASEVRSHFTGGTGISISSGDIALDFTEFDTSNVVEDPSATGSSGTMYYTDARADARIAAASIDDLSDVVLGTLTDGHGLVYNSTTGRIELAELPGAAGGEANTGSNVGSGAEIFQSKSGVDFRFRRINVNDGNIIVTQNLDDIDIDVVSQPVFGNLMINSEANTIENISTNANLILKPNGTGTVDVSTSKITSVADPTSAQDAATKAYVDGQVSSISTILTVGDGSSTDNVTVGTDTLVFAGTANEVTTTVTDNTITIGLPADVVIGNDLTIGGDLTVTGTTTTVNEANLSIADSYIYLNSGDAIGADNTNFTGSGLDDGVFEGYFEGATTTTYYVRIDGTGTPDTFEWSKDNFATTEATGVAITGNAQTLDNNIKIHFGATTGHTSGDTWDGTASPVSIDTGLWSNENTGASDPGYTHVGIYFDVTDRVWRFVKEYDPEPTGAIDINHASFSYAPIEAQKYITGSLEISGSTISTTATNQDITIDAAGTGSVVVTSPTNIIGNTTLLAQSDLRFADGDSSNWVAFQAPPTIASNVTWTLPSVDASVSGYALVSDAAGTLSWAAAGATTTSDTTTNAERQLYFGSITSGAVTAVNHDAGLTYNPSTGTITADNFSGLDTSATALASAQNFSLTGDVTASAVSFDGTGAVTLTTAMANNSVDLGTHTTGNYIATGAVSGVGLSGSASSEGATFTVTSNATNANTASTIVARDASGNFSAGTITANLTGNVTGNASTASAWATGRTLSLTGDVTGTSASFTGSGNISIATTIAANSVALGTDTTGNYVAAGATSGNGISGSVSSEGGTFTVTSNATNANTGSTIVFRDGSGNFSAGTITASLSGTATNATNFDVAADNTTNATHYPIFVGGASGNQRPNSDSGFTYNPSTNTLTTGTFSGTATQAQYADLAEVYETDIIYPAGTVVVVGGNAEVTAAQATSEYIAGVVSTDPAYLMNKDADGQAIALVGRVPVRIIGNVVKGQPVFAANGGLASTTAPGKLVGIALETNSNLQEKNVECMLKV